MSRRSYKRAGIALFCLLVMLMAQIPAYAAAGNIRAEEHAKTVSVSQNHEKRDADVQETGEPLSGISQMSQRPDEEERETQENEEAAKLFGVTSLPLLILTAVDSLIILAILSVLGIYIWKQFGKPM